MRVHVMFVWKLISLDIKAILWWVNVMHMAKIIVLSKFQWILYVMISIASINLCTENYLSIF